MSEALDKNRKVFSGLKTLVSQSHYLWRRLRRGSLLLPHYAYKVKVDPNALISVYVHVFGHVCMHVHVFVHVCMHTYVHVC